MTNRIVNIRSSCFLPARRSSRPQLFSCCSAPHPPPSSSSSFSFRGRISSSSCRVRIDSAAFGFFSYRPNSTRKAAFPVRGGVESKSEPGGSEASGEVDVEEESRLEADNRGSVENTLVEARRRAKPRVGAETSAVSMMVEILDLEKQFSFYGAYHNNKVNIFIHMLFVWPIFYTSLILWAYTAPLAPLPLPAGTLPLQEYMVLNGSFVQAAIYGLYYIALDKKAGSLGALICLGCWIGANAVAQALPWSLSWKIVLASQVTCWFFQVFGHQKFEGRAPALLDNLPQAFLMAPFFVLLEFLQAFGYEPYPGFQKKVQKNVDDAIREFKDSNVKKAA